MKPHALTMLALALGFASSLSTRPAAPATAQAAGASSCSTCHEVQGQYPVSEKGPWHLEHTFGDLCNACHGGNSRAANEESAHAGVTKNPLSRAATTCATCHPDDYASLADHYANLIAPTTTSTVVPTLRPSATLAVPGTPSPPPPSPTSTTPSGVSSTPIAPGPAGMDWLAALRFVRGPLFRAALWFFVAGMSVRLWQIVRLGWRRQRAPARGSLASGVVKSFLKGLIIWPYIPWVRGIFRPSAVTYLAGGMLHLGLLTVIFLSRTHMLVWKGILGIGWATLPPNSVGWLAASAIVAMVALLIRRLVNPVLKMLSGPAEWFNWLFVFLPMVTGFVLARRWWLPYEVAFSVHMLFVDALLVWIPLSRLSHFLFYFFSRTIHGVEFGRGISTR